MKCLMTKPGIEKHDGHVMTVHSHMFVYDYENVQLLVLANVK